MVVPNLPDDAHGAPFQMADGWRQQHIRPQISSPAFQKNGLFIIVFDAAATSDVNHGGGHVAIISPLAKKGYQSTTSYQHQSTLRLILRGLGCQAIPDASSAAEMAEFFGYAKVRDQCFARDVVDRTNHGADSRAD
jgi:hypothetical protein